MGATPGGGGGREGGDDLLNLGGVSAIPKCVRHRSLPGQEWD